MVERRLPKPKVAGSRPVVRFTIKTRGHFPTEDAARKLLALATVLPDRGVELHSFYTGHDRLGETSVTHLLLAPGGRELRAEPCRNSEIPVMWARRRCLYDHLQCLADWLRELGHEDVRIELDDDAPPASTALGVRAWEP